MAFWEFAGAIEWPDFSTPLPKERQPWWRHREGQEGKDNLDKTRKDEGTIRTRKSRHVDKM
jgi:hypothetical protein